MNAPDLCRLFYYGIRNAICFRRRLRPAAVDPRDMFRREPGACEQWPPLETAVLILNLVCVSALPTTRSPKSGQEVKIARFARVVWLAQLPLRQSPAKCLILWPERSCSSPAHKHKISGRLDGASTNSQVEN